MSGRLKEHYLYISIIVIVAIFLVREGIGFYNVMYPGDALSQFLSNEIVIKESFLQGAVPLWDPFIMSGTPLLAKAQSTVFSVYSLIMILLPTPYLATTFNSFLHVVLLGLGVYWLGLLSGLEKKFAILPSLVVLLSAYVAVEVFFGIFQLMGITYFVYLLIFVIKGLRKRNFIEYALLSSVFSSMMFFSGAFEMFTFSFWVVLYVLVFNLFGKGFNKRLLKSFLFGVVFLLVAVGLVFVKLLPALELAEMSQRQGATFDFERSIGSHLNIKNSFNMIVDDRALPNLFSHSVKGTDSLSIGIIAFLLVLVSFGNFKKKKYLFYLLMGVLGLLMITRSPWNWILWKYFPFFSKQKHVMKAKFVFLIVSAILSGFGFRFLVLKFKKFEKLVYGGVILLLVVGSWGFTYDMEIKDSRPEIEGNLVMKFMSSDTDMFRFKAYETNGIDWGTNYYSKFYGLSDVYGYENLWLIDYMPMFLSVANQDMSKMFGILNMKYMTSMNELNISGFELAQKFDDLECEYVEGEIKDFKGMPSCPGYDVLLKAWGPYLYENTEFLPRAYLVKDSVLVLGEGGLQLVYGLMLDSRFDPFKSVIISGKNSINDYSFDDIKKYSAVFLAPGSIDENSGGLLKWYVDNGGLLFPNVILGQSSVLDSDVTKMFDGFSEGVLVSYVQDNFNKYSAEVEGPGWLVVSEKFSMFPGWETNVGEIFRADGIISTVYVEHAGEVVFDYKPESFVLGRNVSVGVLVLILSYFGFLFYRRKNET
jgi:hypothetical protein